jgi:diadenosine tetraphosphate (Ap4A) HIT family hydrolase
MEDESLLNIENARNPLQIENMQKIAAEGICPFCPEHMEKYHKPPILRRGTYWYITPNMYPYEHSIDHILFVTNRHVSISFELSADEWLELQEHINWVMQERGLTHGTLVMRSGDMSKTGSTVLHLHAQLVVGDGTKPVITRVG